MIGGDLSWQATRPPPFVRYVYCNSSKSMIQPLSFSVTLNPHKLTDGHCQGFTLDNDLGWLWMEEQSASHTTRRPSE